MNKISFDEIKKLSGVDQKAPAITIYLPTHKASSPPNMSEDQLRFKNLAAKAAEVLDSRDPHNPFNKELQETCAALQADRDFWEHMTESIVICIRPGVTEYFHLPIDSEEYVSVSDHFHLAPVLGLLSDLKQYHVLNIAEHAPLLFEGDPYELTVSNVELPKSLEDALNIDEMHQKSLQHASVRSPKGAEYHGHGASKDPNEGDRLRYLKMLDEIIMAKTDTSRMLVLAGIDPDVSAYRTLSSYPNLMEKHINGIYTTRDTVVLHRKSMELIGHDIIQEERAEIVDRYERLHGNSPERTAETMAELKDAADNGRIDTLLVGMIKITRDTVRDNMDQVRMLTFPGEDTSLAIDYIAQQVVSQSGKVINIPQDKMPSHKLMVAITRY